MSKVDQDPMSPSASPSSKTGVRRVNKLPLALAGGIAVLFVLVIFAVAVKRGNNASEHQPVAAQETKKSTSTKAMVLEVIGDHASDSGLIAAKDETAKDDGKQTVLIAPVPNPDQPPLPTTVTALGNSGTRVDGGDIALGDVGQAAMQIRQAKMQMFQDAVKAKTSVQLPNLLATSGTSSKPQSREEVRERIAAARRQLEESGDPAAAYQAKLEKVKASLGAGGGPTDGASPQQLVDRNDIQQFSSKGSGDRWSLNQEVQAPRSRFEIRAGAVIPGVMISGVNSDLPGQIMGQVSQDVFDTATGNFLLIPQGTRLIGTYSSNIAYGQSAVLIAWQRLVFPDGKALDISAMPGADSAGYAGFRDQVDNHYLRIFGSALLLSAVTAGITYSQDVNNSSTSIYTQPTASSVISQALGQQLGQVAAQMIAKNLNIAPTLEIRPGYVFNIIVVKDVDFTSPYKSFDY